MTRRQPLSHLRGTESFRRKPGSKAPRSVTLIVCEGETEQEYFKAARIKYGLTTAEVIVADNTVGSAPSSVVECAEHRCAEPGSYDHIFCVFDRDDHESFDRARANQSPSQPQEETLAHRRGDLHTLLRILGAAAPCQDGRALSALR